MTVTTSFPQQVFSSSVPSVTLITDETRVHAVVSIGGDEIYNEYLYPDGAGNIEILDMPDMVSVHVRRTLAAELRWSCRKSA